MQRLISFDIRGYMHAAALLSIMTFAPAVTMAYPEFQAYSQNNSGMGVSCGMCHVSPDGPEGAGLGQIGGLNKEEMGQLNEARTAFEPGKKVSSPILNVFGNAMVQQLGRKQIIELKSRPEELGNRLDAKSDLDDDGVPDAREYAEGTHPLHKSSGNPRLLFLHNLKSHPFPILMVILATLSTLYGLRNLHLALEARAAAIEGEDEPGDQEEPENHPAAVESIVGRKKPAKRLWKVKVAEEIK